VAGKSTKDGAEPGVAHIVEDLLAPVEVRIGDTHTLPEAYAGGYTDSVHPGGGPAEMAQRPASSTAACDTSVDILDSYARLPLDQDFL
jgi:hypothetical protein